MGLAPHKCLRSIERIDGKKDIPERMRTDNSQVILFGNDAVPWKAFLNRPYINSLSSFVGCSDKIFLAVDFVNVFLASCFKDKSLPPNRCDRPTECPFSSPYSIALSPSLPIIYHD
jgi:hypothetical protein